MLNFHKILVTLTTIWYVYVNGKINETYLTRCTRLQTNTDTYTSMFPITKFHRDGKDILLTFYVKSGNCASIKLLQAEEDPTNLKKYSYEIFLSSSSHTPSEIRLNTWVMTKHFESDILSSDEWRPFWIRISSGRLIQIGKEKGSSAFMSWKDERPMPINHFGFGGFGSNTVKWAFRCPNKTNSRNLTRCVKITTEKTEYYATFPIIHKVKDGKNIFLPFYVKAERDAHIIFSPTAEPAQIQHQRVYEIVLGAEGNSKVLIRSARLDYTMAHTSANNIVSPNEWRPFWIRIGSDGFIEVGKEIGSPAFISWKDKYPRISAYSVASGYGYSAKWAIECPKKTSR